MGNYELVITSRRGAVAESVVLLDDLSFGYTPGFDKELAQELDEEAAKATTTTPAPTGASGGTNAPGGSTTEKPGGGGDGEEDGDGSKSSGTSIVVILTVICIILAIALIFVSVKYWNLKKELVGDYSVTPERNHSVASGGGNNATNHPAFDNPLYSGQHTPADRYGNIDE